MIELLDMLLFGAPGGKTEIIGGMTTRVVCAKTTAEAQQIFNQLARDICRYCGEPWSDDYVAGCELELGRMRLRRDSTLVTLDVKVTIDTWRAFDE